MLAQLLRLTGFSTEHDTWHDVSKCVECLKSIESANLWHSIAMHLCVQHAEQALRFQLT